MSAAGHNNNMYRKEIFLKGLFDVDILEGTKVQKGLVKLLKHLSPRACPIGKETLEANRLI